MADLIETAPPVLVILAAGAGRRLGQAKGAADLLGGSTLDLLQRSARAGAGPGARGCVVTGAWAPLIRPRIAPGFREVHCATWEQGRTGSLAAAAQAFPGCDLCVAPIDVPCVPPEVFRTLWATWAEAGAPERGWLSPCWAPTGSAPRFGHPLVLGRGLAAELPGAHPDQPLRVWRARAEPLLRCWVDSPAILDDLDRPEDLRRLRRLRLRGER